MHSTLALVLLACTLTTGQVAVQSGPILKVEKLIDFERDQLNLFDYCPATNEFFLCFRDENTVLYRWDEKRRELKVVTKTRDDEHCSDLAISPNGKLIVLTTYGHGRAGAFRVLFINAQTNQLQGVATLEHPVRSIQISDDQKLIAIQPTSPKTTYIYDAAGATVDGDSTKRFLADSSPLVWLVPGEKSSRPQGLFLRDNNGKTIHLHKSPDEFVLSKDKTITACSTMKGELIVWRTSDAHELLRHSIGERVVRVRYDPVANRLLVGGGEKGHLSTVSVVDLEPLRQR